MNNQSKKCLYTLFILLITFVACTNPSPTIYTPVAPENTRMPVLPADYDSNLIIDKQDLDEEFAKATRYEVSFTIADDYQHISGHSKVVYTNTETWALNEIIFRLFPNAMGEYLQLKNARVNGEECQPVFFANKTTAQFNLKSPLQPDGTCEIEMDFELLVPTDPSANYGLFAFYDDILSLYEFVPLIPVYDEGWYDQLSPDYGDQVFSDISFFTVNVDAPQALVLASSGVRTNSKIENGRRQDTFVAGPVRDFYLTASPSYQIKSTQQGEVKINVYYPPLFPESGEFVLEVGKTALGVFSQEIGEYPYTELDLVAAPMQGAYGMEYSGIVAIGSFLFDPQASVRGKSAHAVLESTVAHEVAHQWFFNVVHNNQVNEPWLDEGMAQFATALYFEKSQGDFAKEEFRQTWWNRWYRTNNANIPIGMPVSAYSVVEYSAIIYGRAPYFIEAIRAKMGDELFFEFLKKYYQTNQWNIVKTEDFRSLAEETCGCELGKLFAEWVYSK